MKEQDQIMGRRILGIAGCWASLTALASEPGRLAYDLSGIDDGPPRASAAIAAAPEAAPLKRLGHDLGEPFERSMTEAVEEQAAVVPPSTPRRPRIEAALEVDMAAMADSNINNASNLPVILVDRGSGPMTAPVGTDARRQAGVGISVGGAAMAELRIARDAMLAADVEAYVVDQEGGAYDDASLLVALGPEIRWRGGGVATVQLLGFQRWYGGVTASVGTGVRGALQLPTGRSQSLRLLGEARSFESDYGQDFGGSMASISLSYDTGLTPSLSGSAGLYLQRYWLDSAAFSNVETGVYGGISSYLGSHFTGGLSVGVSRAAFDAPLAWMSPQVRRDWRAYGTLFAQSRQPLLWGLHPRLAYTYSRTDSSVSYYDADRHVIRLSLGGTF